MTRRGHSHGESLPQDEAADVTRLAGASERIAEHLGLHFAGKRLADLRRHLEGAADDLGFDGVNPLVEWLSSRRPTGFQLDVLAGHLTVGETYFFRDSRMFDILARDVLPRIIGDRRGRGKYVRLWSAGCASGEEAYSLAILLQQVLPDLDGWNVHLLATDVNTKLLRKGQSAVYGDWSFRGGQRDFRDRYFTPAPERRYAVIPRVRKLVVFERLNLVEETYPSTATGTNDMDVILCRNVLMYFTRRQAERVIRRLRDSLVPGGWLIVSPTETSQELFRDFTTINDAGLTFYRKIDPSRKALTRSRAYEPDVPAIAPAQPPPQDRSEDSASVHAASAAPACAESAAWLYAEGRYSDAIDVLLPQARGETAGADVFSLLVRSFANSGRLHDAREWCDRWIASHKLDAGAYYLRAVVLVESGDADEARRSLHQALYIEPGLALAHFTLATLAVRAGRSDEAERCFQNALRALAPLDADEPLPESDGLTAGRLIDTIVELTRRD